MFIHMTGMLIAVPGGFLMDYSDDLERRANPKSKKAVAHNISEIDRWALEKYDDDTLAAVWGLLEKNKPN